MSFRERREHAAVVKGEIRSARERLGVALQSMDYMAALATQIELDHLESEVCRLEHRHGH